MSSSRAQAVLSVVFSWPVLCAGRLAVNGGEMEAAGAGLVGAGPIAPFELSTAFLAQASGDSPFPQAAGAGSQPEPDYALSLYGRYWRPSIYGNLFITKGGKSGSATRINVRDDLGLDDTDSPQAGIRFDDGDHRLSFQYLPLELEGRDTVKDPFVFHATTYPTGERVKSDLKLDFFLLQYDYRLLSGSAGDLRFGVGAYYWVFDATVKGTGPGGTLNEHRGFSSLLPEAHLDGEVRLDWFHIGAHVGGGLLSSDHAILDTEGYLGVRLWGQIDLDAGYRLLHFDMKATTNKADVSLHGPFFQLVLRFY